MKINSSMMQKVSVLGEHGIPAICGIPLVSSILEYSISSDRIYYKMDPSMCNHEDIHVQINLLSGTSNGEALCQGLRVVSEDNILQIAKEACLIDWSFAIDIFKRVRMQHIWYSGNHNPVYFILKKKTVSK